MLIVKKNYTDEELIKIVIFQYKRPRNFTV